MYTDGVGTTAHAGALRLDRELNPSVRDALQAMTEDGYADFISLVSEFRNMEQAATDAVARGRVWTGLQAHEHGLIDHLGGLPAAAEAAARRADIDNNYQLSYINDELGLWQSVFTDLTAKALVSLDIELPSSLFSTALGLPRDIDLQLRQQLEPLLRSYDRPAIMAHCLCITP